MKNLIFKTAVLSLSLLLGACGGQQNNSNATSNIADAPLVKESLAQSYQNLFQVGAAINRRQAIGDDIAGQKVVEQHYNVLTAENDMKWESIQSQEGVFTFEGADALVHFAEKTNKDIIGHVLVWHSQTPDWVFEDANGDPVTRDVLLERMKTQIFALAGRYKGKIKGWDVVNEAFNEDGSFRESKWFTIIGEDFIDKAFEFANQADPKAQLYYNDYTLYKPAKMNAAIALAKRLRSKGLRIDGIGIQGHYTAPPPVDELEVSIQSAIAADLFVMITELDISVLKFPQDENMGADISLNFELQEQYNPYANGMDKAAQARLSAAYIDLFSLFVRYHKNIDRVTLWGVSDANTWRNNWPINGRTDYPLPFDRDYKAKPFVQDIIALAEQHNTNTRLNSDRVSIIAKESK